jgi:hypothetical protein
VDIRSRIPTHERDLGHITDMAMRSIGS